MDISESQDKIDLPSAESSPTIRQLDRVTVDIIPSNQKLGTFSTKRSTEAIMLMDIDELWKMCIFQQSDEEILAENINILENENKDLRE